MLLPLVFTAAVSLTATASAQPLPPYITIIDDPACGAASDGASPLDAASTGCVRVWSNPAITSAPEAERPAMEQARRGVRVARAR